MSEIRRRAAQHLVLLLQQTDPLLRLTRSRPRSGPHASAPTSTSDKSNNRSDPLERHAIRSAREPPPRRRAELLRKRLGHSKMMPISRASQLRYRLTVRQPQIGPGPMRTLSIVPLGSSEEKPKCLSDRLGE